MGSEDVKLEHQQLTDLVDQKNELLSKVHGLKKELQDWRSKLDFQVKAYRNEITDLRMTLNSEIESLRMEFTDLRSTLKQQLDMTSGLAAKEVADAEAKLAATTLAQTAQKSQLQQPAAAQ